MQTHINIFGEDANGVHINKINDDYLTKYSEKVIQKHRDAMPTDHADGSIGTQALADGAVTTTKIADGAITEDKLSLDVTRIIEKSGWAVTTITLTDDVYSLSNGAGAQGQIIVVQNSTGKAVQYVSLENYSMTFDRYISIGEIVVCRCISMSHDGARYETIMTLYVDEKVASSDILDGAVGMSKLDEEVIENLNKLETAISTEVDARQTLDKNLTAEINSKADDIHEHTMADITDLSEAAKTLLDSVSDEDEFTTRIGRDLKVSALHIEGDPTIRKNIHFTEAINGYIALSEMAEQINTNKGDIKSLKETANAIEVSSHMNVSVFAEEGRITLITYNPEIAEPINDYIVSNSSDELYYNISQPIEAGKAYLAVTTKAHEINDTSYIAGELQLYPLDSITVDGELSDTSENPVQNKVIKAELDKKYEIPNNNADTLLQSVVADQSGNGIQIGADVFIPCLVAGQGIGGSGFAILDNVSFGETEYVTFTQYEGFDTLKGVIDAICDLREMVSALEG